MQFEELCLRQCEWAVPDQELRESLRLAVAEVLLPAYRSFIKRFGYVRFYKPHICMLMECLFLRLWPLTQTALLFAGQCLRTTRIHQNTSNILQKISRQSWVNCSRGDRQQRWPLSQGDRRWCGTNQSSINPPQKKKKKIWATWSISPLPQQLVYVVRFVSQIRPHLCSFSGQDFI